MGMISIRLNKEEEKILKKLSEHFHEDKSALVKKSLLDLYENVMDLDAIKKFETKERKGKVSFFTAEDILKNR
jgi:predicted transcriptional regulator